MRKRGLTAGLCVILVAVAALAKEPLLECGSYFTKPQEESFLHRRHAERQIAFRAATSAARFARTNQDVGEIAVIGGGNGVVGTRNPIDLVSKTITFTPAGTSYSVASTAGDSFDAPASQNGTRLDLDDDDFQKITLPFPFPFQGSTYTQAFVNSNGTITFNQGDVDFTGAFGHFTAGAPVIAGLFTDLNPLSSSSGVRVLTEAGRVVITFADIPLVGDNFFNATQTFQMRLYPQGRIELTYTSISSNFSQGVVGLAPGGSKPVDLVDLTTATGPFANGVAESFTSSFSPEIDMMAAAQRFYQTHDDSYDYLVFYNAMGVSAGSGVVAYELTTRSQGEGYGDTFTENGNEYGSERRLQAVLNLGPTTQYPLDPFAPVPTRGVIGDTPLTILAHEAGHLFLALVSVPSPTNSAFPPMLGAGKAHWAFPFNSDASFLEGNRITDQGPGANPRFLTTATVQRYSDLDQYLMGMRLPQDVPPTFAVLNSGSVNSRAPQTGVSFNGTRLDIPVNDVIQAAGRRKPDATVAQREFRMAFVMIVDENADIGPGTPAAAAIAQVNAYRTAFEPFFATGTSFRGTLSTTLRKGADWSLAPNGGVSLGGETTATLRIAAPAQSPLNFTIETPTGVTTAPATVTIPTGATSVSFPVTGARIGVEEMRAVPADASYHTAIARVPVRPRSELHVQVASGDLQDATAGPLPDSIVVRAVDENNVPYSNQPLTVSVAGGGQVSPTTATTDAFGQAVFQWTTTAGSFNTLTFAIPGAPSSAAAATALGVPGVFPGGVVNSASYGPGIAAGGFASIFGGSLAAGVVAQPPTSNFPTTLANVSVTVNGILGRLSYVSDGLINFVIPGNISPGPAQLVIQTPLGTSASVTIQIAAHGPGTFYDTGTGAGAVLIAGPYILTQERPAKAGEYLAIFCTGLGANPAATVTIGGVPVTVTYAGITLIPGLEQVNVLLPAGLPHGTQDLVLTVNGITANSVHVVLD